MDEHWSDLKDGTLEVEKGCVPAGGVWMMNAFSTDHGKGMIFLFSQCGNVVWPVSAQGVLAFGYDFW